MHRFATDGIEASWKTEFDAFFGAEEGKNLLDFLQDRLQAGAVIYPPDPYRVFRLTQPQDVRVVILGQDPYHGPGQAMGMAFSVPAELKNLPPSLKNIFKELALEGEGEHSAVGDLSSWVQQGVLLMNATLTVEAGAPQSHAGKGWETLTDRLIDRVLEEARPVVFMLWGAKRRIASKPVPKPMFWCFRAIILLLCRHVARRCPLSVAATLRLPTTGWKSTDAGVLSGYLERFRWSDSILRFATFKLKKGALFRCKIGDN